MELSHLPGRVVEGEVSYIYPTMNAKSRTLTVRLEFDNPGVQLKPGMFATVYIQYRRKDDVIAAPTSAVLHSGRRELVFVALGQGRFEPREITTGLVGDHRMTEVLDGLDAGEQVVVNGQFLIDSESQLQEALQKILAGAAGLIAEQAAHHTLWSCPMHPEVLSEEPGRCPDCNMFLEFVPGGEAAP
jgi:Cu(I)/Ag(I) efflux system membrane fusion protein/cobalt-zinc-cadmium efflux system membrane fusion protein